MRWDLIARGVIMGLGILLTAVFLQAAYSIGYQAAYHDMKKGTIESYVKKEFPKLWIEFNAKD